MAIFVVGYIEKQKQHKQQKPLDDLDSLFMVVTSTNPSVSITSFNWISYIHADNQSQCGSKDRQIEEEEEMKEKKKIPI